MSESARVGSAHALAELRVAEIRFGEQAAEALASAARDIQRTGEWLAERHKHWTEQIRRRTEAVRQAADALARCRSGKDNSCGYYEQLLRQAQKSLLEAQEALKVVQQWTARIQEVVKDYQRQSVKLSAMLGSDLPRATAWLAGQAATLESYLSLSASGLGGDPDAQRLFQRVNDLATVTRAKEVAELEALERAASELLSSNPAGSGPVTGYTGPQAPSPRPGSPDITTTNPEIERGGGPERGG